MTKPSLASKPNRAVSGCLRGLAPDLATDDSKDTDRRSPRLQSKNTLNSGRLRRSSNGPSLDTGSATRSKATRGYRSADRNPQTGRGGRAGIPSRKRNATANRRSRSNSAGSGSGVGTTGQTSPRSCAESPGQATLEYESVPYVRKAVHHRTGIPAGSTMQILEKRADWEAISHELVVVCNEAARRRAVMLKPARLRFFKPLSDEYIQDRLYYDDPCFGLTVRQTGTRRLQGFVIATTWTVWQSTFRWENVDVPNTFISPMDQVSHRCDSGVLATALNACPHGGDPRQEGVIWDRICEVSVLGALGCGRWLLFQLFRRLMEADSHDFVVLQATHAAVPFYERVGFSRVGTVAQAKDNQLLPSVAYRHWTTSWHAVRATKGDYEDASYVMAIDLRKLSLKDVRALNFSAVAESAAAAAAAETSAKGAARRDGLLKRPKFSRSVVQQRSFEHAEELLRQAVDIDPCMEGAAFTYEELVGQALKLAMQADSARAEHMVATLQGVVKAVKASSPGGEGFGTLAAAAAAKKAYERERARMIKAPKVRRVPVLTTKIYLNFSVLEGTKKALRSLLSAAAGESSAAIKARTGGTAIEDRNAARKENDAKLARSHKKSAAGPGRNAARTENAPKLARSNKKPVAGHECTLCGRIFPSTNARGGHLRFCRLRSLQLSSPKVSTSAKDSPNIDLSSPKVPCGERTLPLSTPTVEKGPVKRRSGGSASAADSKRARCPTTHSPPSAKGRPKRASRRAINYNISEMFPSPRNFAS
eukprot:INCI1875.1.p1 GENE.INCI1875.1~~INCI1875.1.p1  ORF type:complete len:763 (+),score=124.12 INCI1875.1:277-2565(+)